MDLMGSDAVQSEDDMARMWGDSIRSVQGQHARITYDDFLLLMKGQTKEPAALELEATVTALVGGTRLPVLSEGDGSFEESPTKVVEAGEIRLASGDTVTVDGKIEVLAAPISLEDSEHTPNGSPNQQKPAQSAPNTPADHRRVMTLEMGLDSPLSMDDDDDLIVASGPGVPGTSASLTPPMSPIRGADDFVTPSAQRRAFCEMKASLELPGLPPVGLSKPPVYTRRRSRSVGDDHDSPEKLVSVKDTDESKRLSAVAEVAEAVRDMMLPESDRTHAINAEFGEMIHDDSKTTLVVNRKLYRAHRHMRLAVLEASKRFEEQQAEHAKEVILAAREEDDSHGMIQAGLVMRHGHKKQVSSKAIRTLLESNRMQQQALVEKANKRGGRGRRSRKKTISDMSGMLSSMSAEDLNGSMLARASTGHGNPEDPSKLYEDLVPEETLIEEEQLVLPSVGESEVPDLPDLAEQEGHLRSATVPGEFRKTSDPFGSAGRYGPLPSWK